jgi:dihydroorotate dehydrogenase
MSGVDGVIVGNTTKRRAGLVPHEVKLSIKEQQVLMETGGFSGPAMFNRTLDLVKRYRKLLDAHLLHGMSAAAAVPAIHGTASGKAGSFPEGRDGDQKAIFATGGITNGQQALRILNAGASVAMVYTGMIYGGAGTITSMKDEMRVAMRNKDT